MFQYLRVNKRTWTNKGSGPILFGLKIMLTINKDNALSV